MPRAPYDSQSIVENYRNGETFWRDTKCDVTCNSVGDCHWSKNVDEVAERLSSDLLVSLLSRIFLSSLFFFISEQQTCPLC
jgi:hypothetical protein